MYNTKLTKWMTESLSDKPFLSVIVPCYNEEARLLPTLGAIIGTLCELDITWELIVVDDGSSDKTAELVESLPFQNSTLLRQNTNQGKGAAVKAGVRAAQGDWVLFTDADNSTPIEEIAHFLPEMLTGQSDLICGSRSLSSSTVEGKSALRHIATKVLATLVAVSYTHLTLPTTPYV